MRSPGSSLPPHSTRQRRSNSNPPCQSTANHMRRSAWLSQRQTARRRRPRRTSATTGRQRPGASPSGPPGSRRARHLARRARPRNSRRLCCQPLCAPANATTARHSPRSRDAIPRRTPPPPGIRRPRSGRSGIARRVGRDPPKVLILVSEAPPPGWMMKEGGPHPAGCRSSCPPAQV